MTRQRRGDVAVFLFGAISVDKGGMTRAVLDRLRLYAEADIPTRLLLTRFTFNEDADAEHVRQLWHLPDDVEIRYFWREAAPGGGGAPADLRSNAREEEAFTTLTKPSGDVDVVEFYHDGILKKTKSFVANGALKTITRFDRAGRLATRDHFDIAGKLVYTDDYHLGTGRPTQRRWFDASGTCWLTSWMKDRALGTSVRHLPSPKAYDQFGQCVAEWVDQVTAEFERPVIMADSRDHDPVLLDIRHGGSKTVAVVHNCHTGPPYRSSDPLRAGYNHVIERIDAIHTVVTLTHRQREDVAARSGRADLKIINHCVQPTEPTDTPRDPRLLVAIARFSTQKRLDHAIRAFAIAARQNPDARFHLYGKGTEEARLRTLIHELDIVDRIELKGFTANAPQVFASATATVLSSNYEGMPLVLMEAMSVGTPFVAYDINYGPAEVIRHEVDGLLVPPGDVDLLAAAMGRVLSDPSYAAKLGDRAREVTDRFSRERWAKAWLQLYADLAA